MPYIGQEPVAGNFVLLDAITTSATATYALTKNSVAYSPESSRNMIVSLNGVTQAPETAYTVSGSNITFSSALTASDVIDYILVLGDVLDIGRPSDGVVGTDQMNYPLGNFSSTGIDDNATSTAITIDSSENVGIGTASPSVKLEVNGEAKFGSGNAFVTSTNVFKSAAGAGVDGAYLRASISGASTPTYANSDDTDTGIFFPADNTLGFSTGATERMRIDSSGNVGINRTSPNGLLHMQSSSGTDSAFYVQTSAATDDSVIYFGDDSSSTIGHILYEHSSNSMQFKTNASERMRIDSSGNLLVGTTDSAFVNGGGIKIANSQAARLKLCDSDTAGTGSTDGFELTQSGTAAYIYQNENDFMAFGTNATERMRLDSSGNLLVGKTSTAFGTAGVEASAGNGLWSTRSSLPALALNRLSTDGSIADFYKDGTAVGSIGSEGGDSLFIFSGDTGLRFSGGADSILPCTTAGAVRDNAIDLGIVSSRFDDIYATNGTIQTSDANEKQDIEALSDAETRVAVAAKGLLRKFRWKSAVEEKGDDARIHFGIIAQDLQAAFEAEGLDAGDYAMFIHSTWTDEETGEERSRMGVRYSELLAFIIAAI